MEVKEAIKWFEWANDVYYDLLKSLEAENKALKKENEAYKGMWEDFKRDCGGDKVYHSNLLMYEIGAQMNCYEQKYLGGGE
jgi:hypothetical protein